MSMPFGLALCLTVAALTVTGCGGTDDPPDIARTAEAGRPLTLTAREYLFTPNRITLRGDASNQRIVLRNQGELAHNIEIFEGDRRVGKLRSFPPGQTRSLSVSLPRGSYRFVCTVADHDEKGMRGTVDLRQP
jgi:plastocyanin